MNEELSRTEDVIELTDNVFEALGLPATEEDLLKVSIARAITRTVQDRKLTQTQAAKILGVDQGKVSSILRGRLKGYSVQRLFKFLLLLGLNVDIHIKAKRSKSGPGRIKVVAA